MAQPLVKSSRRRLLQQGSEPASKGSVLSGLGPEADLRCQHQVDTNNVALHRDNRSILTVAVFHKALYNPFMAAMLFA